MRQAAQIVLAAGLASGAAHAASFVQFSGLQGESQDKDHKGWSDVLSYSQSVSKQDCANFALTKEADTITPAMAEAAANGGKFDSATIASTASYTDSGRIEYFRAAMRDVVVRAVSQGSGGGESPLTESIALAPAVVTITYTQVDATGKVKGSISTTYTCKVKP
jgi:type VI secretion system secreted protein Hcp